MQKDATAFKNSDYAVFAKNKSFRPNFPVRDVNINSLKFGFDIDFRNYIEDGMYRRRILGGGGYITLGGDVTVSNNSLLATDLSYKNYEMRINGSLNTLGSGSLGFRVFGFYADNAIPIQHYHSLPGNIELTGRDYSFRTLNVNEITADRGITIMLNHNLRDELFRSLGFAFLTKIDVQLNHYFNMSWTSVSAESKTYNGGAFTEFKKPFIETGFGIGHALFPFTFEFSWKLTHRGNNNFRFGIATPLI